MDNTGRNTIVKIGIVVNDIEKLQSIITVSLISKKKRLFDTLTRIKSPWKVRTSAFMGRALILS